MPRTSERAQALEDIDAAIEHAVYAYALASSSDEEDDSMEDLEYLPVVQEVIASNRYLSRNTSASRHESDVLEDYIRNHPENAFLALFRMHRASFWHLVEILTHAGGGGVLGQ